MALVRECRSERRAARGAWSSSIPAFLAEAAPSRWHRGSLTVVNFETAQYLEGVAEVSEASKLASLARRGGHGACGVAAQRYGRAGRSRAPGRWRARAFNSRARRLSPRTNSSTCSARLAVGCNRRAWRGGSVGAGVLASRRLCARQVDDGFRFHLGVRRYLASFAGRRRRSRR